MPTSTQKFPRDTAGLPAASATRGRRARRRRPRSRCASRRWPSASATRRCGCSPTTAPSPARRCGCPQGAEVVVDIENEGDMEATVHWHGLRLENRYDGTHETQEPIPVGGRYTARVTFPDPGVYWYHPHIREDYGQELGLYGNVIVVPADPDYWPPVHRELALTLDDVLIEDGQIAAVQPRRDHLRGDGPLRQRAAGRRRARARAHRAGRRGRAPVPDEHRQHPRVQGRAARRADEARRRRQRPRRARAVRRRRRAGAVGAGRRRRAVRDARASWRWSTARPTGPTSSPTSPSPKTQATPSLAEAFATLRTDAGARPPSASGSRRWSTRRRTRRWPSWRRWTWASPTSATARRSIYACPMHPEVDQRDARTAARAAA